MFRIRRTILSAIALASVVVLAACSSTPATNSKDPSTVSKTATTLPAELRFGYFPNFTHAVAMVALEKGYLAKRLGPKVKITPLTFNAGPAAVEAIFANSVDVSLIGPNPTITGFTQSQGAALEVIAGASSGGAALVVRGGINSVKDLKGKTIASPQLGNTQDVALRYWLKQHGLKTTAEGGGDVNIVPQDNGTALTAFESGKIDGAWVPEPWVTRMVAEGHGKILVNEASLWSGGKFVVANTVAATPFAKQYPAAITAVVAAEMDAVAFIQAHPTEAKALVNANIKALTGSSIAPANLEAAWKNVDFTIDPLPATLLASAQHAHSVGLLDSYDLKGLYSLGALNALLTRAGQKSVTVPAAVKAQ